MTNTKRRAHPSGPLTRREKERAIDRAERRKRQTAYHEAGHAVIAFYLFLPFRYASVKPADGALGHVRFRKAPKWAYDEYSSRPLAQRAFWENHIIVSFAGRIAEQKYRGSRVRLGHESDYRGIADMGLRFGGDDPKVHVHWFRWLQMRAKGMVDTRWREIEAVAEALLKHERLTRDEIQAVIDARLGLTPLKVTRAGESDETGRASGIMRS